MMKKTLYVVGSIVFLSGIILWALTRSGNDRNSTLDKQDVGSKSEKVVIVTTLFPLYDMARAIGGDDADVSLLLPPGMSPHTFDPKPSDIARIAAADVFVYTGAFMEPWAEETLRGIGRDDIRVVDGSEGVSLLAADEEHEEHEEHGSEGGDVEHEHEHEHEHEQSGNDPHIWLDFENAEIMAVHIAEALADADPGHATRYAERSSDYVVRLSELDRKYRDNLAVCRTKKIVYGGHYAFGYLAHRYNLDYVAAQGFSPDAEPTAKELAELVSQVRSLNLSHVFSETLTSPRIAETIASETGASVLELNPAGNLSSDAFERKTTFFDIMEDNLGKLQTGLGCMSAK
ncbi:MAG: zinc ABC transporter solute-binding protein [Candidatus Moranbacteria bacterium]|nr:zinc ABC transporter solute-binding protein [Candidatus Moranbacteria bacterium]